LSRTLELGRFVVEPDQEQQFLAKREAMVKAAKENFPGLIDITLAKLDDGSYVDVAFWEDRSFVKTAIAKAETIPAVVDWLQHIGEDLSTEFGTVVDADHS
jgi:heme-degrading monooxygenase HmoA